MSEEDPVKKLTDTLTLLRVEIAEVKDRQATDEMLKEVIAVLKDTAIQFASVQEAAAIGAHEGAEQIVQAVEKSNRQVNTKVDVAVESLSKASQEVKRGVLSNRRTLKLLILSTGLCGLFLGAFLGMVVVEYNQLRDFKKSINGFSAKWSCELAGGTVTKQDDERKLCWFELP